MPASTKGGSKQNEDGWERTLVTLEKKSAKQGFGIAISGGLDNPHFKTGDTSIIVSDIVQGSPADGKLKVGDILISVNERNVDGRSHHDAVEALKAAGMEARMEIKRPSSNPPKKNVDNLNDSKVNGSKETDSERGRSRKKPKEMEQESGKKHHSSHQKEDDHDGEKPRHRSKSREKGEEGEKSSRSHNKSLEDNADTDRSERSHRSRSKNREDSEGGDKSEKSHRSRSKNREDNAEGEKSHRSRSKNREDAETGEKSEKSHRSRSKNREDAETGEKSEKSHRSRSRNREDAETGEKSHRSRSKNREDPETEEKSLRSKSKTREDLSKTTESEKSEKIPKSQSKASLGGMEKENSDRQKSKTREDAGEEEKARIMSTQSKPNIIESSDKHRSRSKTREDTEGVEKPRSRSTQRKPNDMEKLNSSRANEDGEKASSRSRSKSRSRDDLTRSKSKESLHRSKSKEALNVDTIKVVLNRGDQGYGFSLGQQIFVKDLAKDSPAAKAKNLEKGDIVREINGTPLDNLKISECIELIRGASETLTLTIVKKPKLEQDIVPEKPKSLEVNDEKPKSKEPSSGKKKQEVSEPSLKTKEQKMVHKEPDQKSSKITPPDRHSSPVPSNDNHNDTKDSWAEATPKKHFSSAAHPNQEVEDMNAKIERLKSNRKLERRMSQLPNAKVISFHKTGSVGIQVAGGNSVGIFVAAIRPDSAAAKEGLKPGDQIIMCNEIDFENITREEAVLILLALPDDVSLVVESKQSTFDQIKKELGDNFFIRVNFDHAEKANTNELTFRKGEIFNVRDTMYQGLIGYWQAQRVGKNAQMLERGVLPNKSRAEQLAIAQKMEERQTLTPSKSKLKRRNSIGGTLKKQKFVSQDRLDELSFTEGVQIPAYERVVLKVADFMRPVVVLGPLADLARIKLLEEMPDRFELPSPSAYDHPGDNNSISLSEIRNVIAKNKHCLLDIVPEGIEMLMYAQLCPIVVMLNSPSRGAVKDMRQSLVKEILSSPTNVTNFTGDPLNAKQVKNLFNNANKLNEFYPHVFTSKINTHIAGGDVLSRAFYEKLKEVIFTQQSQSAWMPEEKPDEMLDDMMFHQPNYISYTSGVDSDTEGESASSSPVFARKHYDDNESPPESPIDDAPVFNPPEPDKKPTDKEKTREKSKDRKRDRSSERDHVKNEKVKKDKDPKAAKERTIEPYDVEPPTAILDKNIDVRSSLRKESSKNVPPTNDYREPPNGYRPPEYNEFLKQDYRESFRDNNRDSASTKKIKDTVYEPVSLKINEKDLLEENVPVLRDPNYVLPKPIPDSPPTRSPPEARLVNSVRVFPTEIKTEVSMDEKIRSLKKVDPGEDHYDSPKRPVYKEPEQLPSYRTNQPEEVPTKVLTLQERMSKFQQKVTSQPPKVAVPQDESPPPRPSAPRNYIIDTRNQPGSRQELYAQNIYKPTTQYPEVKQVLSKSNPIVEPYATVNFAPSVESSVPNYDIVKPRSQLTTNLDYGNSRQEQEPSYLNNSDSHYKQPSKYEVCSFTFSDDEPKVIATARGWFDHRGGLLESSETNVSIYIPAGALPAGRQQEVYFKVCQDSKHMPPLDSSSGETLLSPLVMCGPHGLKFKKPIELRLPHKGATSDGMAFSLKSSDSTTVGGSGPGHWKNVKLGGRDLDSGRAYQVTDDTVSVLVDHF
uniref:Tight junction protein ZO-1 n=1 Tax=Hydra vulgaris TaxID=6087 RepID=T2MDH6_HYDVU